MEIFAKLKDIVSEQLGVDNDQITLNSHFQDDLNADPLSMADLVVSVEETFKVKIPQEELIKFSTVGDVVNFLTDSMAEV